MRGSHTRLEIGIWVSLVGLVAVLVLVVEDRRVADVVSGTSMEGSRGNRLLRLGGQSY